MSVADQADWDGRLEARASGAVTLRVQGVLGQGAQSASSPFLALGSDGQEWWVKAPHASLQKALVTELVVGRVGQLIGAPVCRVEPIFIGPELLPHEIRPGVPLEPGIGTATLNLPGTVDEIRPGLTHRTDDDNRVRQAGIYALVDLCFGSDLQWLHRVDADWEIHSHDHGWYLPPSGADWTEDELRAHVDDPCPVPGDDPAGLDPAELERLARTLDGLQENQLVHILQEVPAEMPVSEHELECLGWFLQQRAPHVAGRLRAI